MDDMNFSDLNSFGFGVPLLCCWHLLGWAAKTHTLGAYALLRSHWSTEIIYTFTGHRNFRHLLALRPPTFGIFMMFHDSRLSYPSRSWWSVVYNWRLYVTDLYFKTLGRFHVTWSGQCTDQCRAVPTYCGQQNVLVKLHLDRSSVGRMTARKPVFDLQ